MTLTKPFPSVILSVLICEMGIWLLLLPCPASTLALAALVGGRGLLAGTLGRAEAPSWVLEGPNWETGRGGGTGGGSRWVSSLPGSFSRPEN